MTRSGKLVHLLSLALAVFLATTTFGCSPGPKQGGPSPSKSASARPDQGGQEPQEATTPLPKGRLNIDENGKVAGDKAELGKFKSFLDAAEAYVASRTEMKGENDFLISGIQQAADGGDAWVSAQVTPVKGGDALHILLSEKDGVWTGVYLGPEADSSAAPASVRDRLFPSK